MVAITYQQRIDALRETKLEHNRAKLARDGYHDVDDHGNIYWPEPIPFTPKSNHPSGGCYGARCIGENFRAWLDVHPVYIHPMSALAGAWAGFIPGVGGWKPEDRPTHLAPLHDKYYLWHNGIGAMNHLGPDMRIGLDLGWGGLLKKIRYYRELNRPTDPSFYDAEENLVLGVQDWIRRHVIQAREMAEDEDRPEIRENLLTMADMNEWLVENPPRTLREACQFLAWFQSIDRMWAAGGALGQLDELLRPYYEADRAAGIIEDEAVLWFIASLFYNDTHYSQIGGEAPDGHDLTSRMSYLILEAAHRLKIPYNLALRVHDGMDLHLLHTALEYHLEDGTGVSFSCSKGLNEGYIKSGVPIQLARMRAKVGCNWTALPGIEYPLQDVTRQSLVAPFLHAFEETVADTGSPRTMEALWERYVHHLAISVDVMKQGLDWHMEHHAQNTIEIVLNLFCHGTMERGLDASAGGVDIYHLTVDGVGLATVADSFAAVEQRVVNEKRLTWEGLKQHLDNDYAGAESIRLMLKNIPRFGSGNSRADFWAKRISQTYVALFDTPTARGYKVLPGLFSHGDIVRLGSYLPATPNGRHAHAPISHSSEPDPGFASQGGGGPTAKANAVAAVQPGRGNSAPLQLDIDFKLMEEQGGIDTVAAMIMAHNQQGGTLINLNIISKEKILEAHADPTKYPDLVVRVTGYSAFFHSLSPEYRQQVVDRLLA
ncbi:MAG TPA: pyruvate formate lyase family protein [Anaerolineae bacterium]|nr:pyruvate formate lyase family protein [Anaerolineae bacterium]HQH39710.1 pyruvate formate lyase family protein [Anaerolineae bacterium]